MTDNVFMISDASYSDNTQCAGLGVVDLYSNKKYSQHLLKIESSSDAEYRALLLSVSIALKNKYNNVVFVYDNKSLDLKSLIIWLHGKIESFQFLWLKRSYVKDADKIARKARELTEKLHIKKSKKRSRSKKKKTIDALSNQQVIEAIRQYNPKKIGNFCAVIATEQEKTLIHNYFNMKKAQEYTPTKNGVAVLMLLCFLLPKHLRKDFFLHVKDRMKKKNYQSKLNRNKPTAFYTKRINKIISKLNSANG